MRTGHIHLDDDLAADGVRRAILESPGEVLVLRYESEESLSPDPGADPFLIATVLLWMQRGVDVRIHGSVSERLLVNLDELQLVWAKWRPERYQRVAMEADHTRGDTPPGWRAITAFSGGVDASFTVLQHLRAERDRGPQLQAALMVHGFDISLDRPDVFERARNRAAGMLSDTGVELVPIRTDFRNLSLHWGDAHALAIASCLTLLSDRYQIGLIGSTRDYGTLVFPWGSTPVQDWMSTSGDMEIRHSGAGYSRTEKVAALTEWPAAMRNLRVCWQGEAMDRNCGTCEKCIRTILNFRAVGADLPEAFEADVSDRQIEEIRIHTPGVLMQFESVLDVARHNEVEESWVRALERLVAAGVWRDRSWKGRLRRRLASIPPLRSAVRHLRRLVRS